MIDKLNDSLDKQNLSDKSGKIKNNYFDGLEVTGPYKMLFFIIMFAYFFEQMDNWNFAFIAPSLMADWGITMADIGKINFAYFVAMTIGGLTGGVISDFIGRRKTFLGSVLIFSIASVANGFAPNVLIFTITRALTGFGVFCLMVCSQVYIAEMTPSATRGKWQSLTASIGFIAAPFIGILCRAVIPLSPSAWRYIFLLGGLGILGFFVGLKYLKESPRWLVAQGKVNEAEQVIEELTKVKVDLSEVAFKVEPKVKIMECHNRIIFTKIYEENLCDFIICYFNSTCKFCYY